MSDTGVPLVSAIIPAYNYGRFLPDALRSVAQQQVHDLELIVVDDGSTDDTEQVLSAWEDPRLLVIRQANHGIMAARGTGLTHARGRYVAFLDADDLWRPDYLTRQLAVLEAEPSVAFCFSNFVRTDRGVALRESQFDLAPGVRRLPTRATADRSARVIEGDPFSALVPLADMPGWLQATVFRREVVSGLRIRPEVGRGEDLYLMLQAYARAGGAAYIDDTLVEVRRHGSNSYSSSDEVRAGVLEVVQFVLADVPLTPSQRTVLRHRIGAEYLRRGWRYFWGHRPREAADHYVRALAWPGTRPSALGHLAALPILPLLPHREPPF